MCLIAFAWNTHPRWRLVLAGNRDEFHGRPTAPLARWPDTAMAAGRDLEAGGTWLGVNDDGRCTVVTNVRDPRDPQVGRSRGLLAVDYLTGPDQAPAHASRLRADAAHYRPFNLLTFDAREGFYLGNRRYAALYLHLEQRHDQPEHRGSCRHVYRHGYRCQRMQLLEPGYRDQQQQFADGNDNAQRTRGLYHRRYRIRYHHRRYGQLRLHLG